MTHTVMAGNVTLADDGATHATVAPRTFAFSYNMNHCAAFAFLTETLRQDPCDASEMLCQAVDFGIADFPDMGDMRISTGVEHGKRRFIIQF